MRQVILLFALCSLAISANYKYELVPIIEDIDYWDDSMVPALSIVGGATAPGLISFATNDLIKIYGFDGGSRDELAHFSIQLPHRYKEGSEIRPHVHWCRTADPGSAAYTNVVWRLVYGFAGVNQHYSQTYTNTITNNLSGTNWLHQIGSFTSITNTNATVSSVFVGSITRVATDGGDSYDQDAGFLGFDIHFILDAPGTRQEYVK